MTSFNQVYAALRKKNMKQYVLVAMCCFISVLLITAYVCIMNSPTVQNIFPEGGDSRKQMMMIFALIVAGCGMFTVYASALFFRHKSREAGIFMALGASRRQLRGLLSRDVLMIAAVSCGLGILLGAPLAWLIWRLFRLLIVDTQEMPLVINGQAFLYAIGFTLFVAAVMFFLLFRFIRRANVMDVIYESRKSEPIRSVPRRYGWAGILLVAAGLIMGYNAPGFFVEILKWFPPEGLTSVFYLPALPGLYMILLHTIVNGWRAGRNRYKNIVTTGMMKFQGRQTVRNMLVITLLVGGAYFASFYAPVVFTGSDSSFDSLKVDYAFHYRADQDLPSREEIEAMAKEDGVVITSYAETESAILGVDGQEYFEESSGIGTSYRREYTGLLATDVFLSESGYNAITGDSADVEPGRVSTVFTDTGENGNEADSEIKIVTNVLTGETLNVEPYEEEIENSVLLARHVLDDGDFERITSGLPLEWREKEVLFNVENVEETYDFAVRLFNEIVDRTDEELAVYDAWDYVGKAKAEQQGEAYWVESDMNQFTFADRDAFNFRSFWKYMPKFRVMDRNDFIKTRAVLVMVFIFAAIVCFAAVLVIAYTRSITIGYNNAQVYKDLKRLGANRKYLLKTLKAQVSKIFFVPILTGTAVISLFYMLILFGNSGTGEFSASEIAAMGNIALLIAAVSAGLYGFYRVTFKKVCGMLGV